MRGIAQSHEAKPAKMVVPNRNVASHDHTGRPARQPNGRLGGAVNLIGKHRHFAARSVRTDGLAYRSRQQF